MALETEQSQLDMYADDSTIGAADKTVPLVEDKLGPDMANLEIWCDENRMAKKSEKTKVMLVTTKQKLSKLPVKELKIVVDEQMLENVEQAKLLGVIVDQNLTWKGHVDKVHKTVSMLLARFRQIKPFLPTDARKKFCQTFILPHFDYCNTVWGSAPVSKLYKLQKRAARMILDLPTQTPTKPLLKKLKWMSVMDRIEYRKAQMVFKSLNGLAPEYMRKMFTYVHEVSTYNTRNATDKSLYISKCKLKAYTDTFAYSSAVIWNKLPVNIRNTESLGAFKSAYMTWFLSRN